MKQFSSTNIVQTAFTLLMTVPSLTLAYYPAQKLYASVPVPTLLSNPVGRATRNTPSRYCPGIREVS